MPHFEVTVQMDTDGDDSVIGFVSMVARELPRQLAPRVAMDFRPWSYVTLTLRIKAGTASAALDEASTRVHAAFELFGREPPGGMAKVWIEEPA